MIPTCVDYWMIIEDNDYSSDGSRDGQLRQLPRTPRRRGHPNNDIYDNSDRNGARGTNVIQNIIPNGKSNNAFHSTNHHNRKNQHNALAGIYDRTATI